MHEDGIGFNREKQSRPTFSVQEEELTIYFYEINVGQLFYISNKSDPFIKVSLENTDAKTAISLKTGEEMLINDYLQCYLYKSIKIDLK